jgi:hypothetical protein
LDGHGKNSLHRTNFKAHKKMYDGKRSILPFSREPLAGENLHRVDARLGWWEPALGQENTA